MVPAMKFIVVALLIPEARSVGLMMAPSAATAGSLAAGGAAAGAAGSGTAAAGSAAAGTMAGSAAAGTAASQTAMAAAMSAGSSAAGSGAVPLTAVTGAKAAGTISTTALACHTWNARKVLGLGAAFLVSGALLGAEADGFAVTWDCWKPVVRELTTAPSRGRPLVDILNDPVISDYHLGRDSVFVRNRWNESWRIDPVVLPWGQVAAHATRMASFNSSAHLSGVNQFSDSINTTEAPKQHIAIFR
eukprot:TRINITY_DN581_c1_g1_i1.p1 TRINITY_DN581_c1_g1~~TRINITY_DN581_c1_g1_i1.p1  ORF type:complete len:246 (-),score=31.45 TRINITY_DN581_c1_g1_i1:229-966(-)